MRWVLLILLLAGSAHAQSIAGVSLNGVSFNVTETAAPDWGDDMIAWWSLDQDTTASRTATGGTCGSGCDLTASGSIPRSTSTKQEGAASVDFDFAETDTLSCLDANCSALERAGSGDHSLTWGCWVYDDFGSTVFPMTKDPAATDTSGYAIRLSSGSSVSCLVGGTGDVAGGFGTNAWHHAACTFDDTANEVETFLDATPTGSPASVSSMTENSQAFTIGGDGAMTDYVGHIDECFVYEGKLSDASICRICSCGISGSLCKYVGPVWTDVGRNVSACGSCALPASPWAGAPS